MPWLPEFEGEVPSLGWAIAETWADVLPNPRDPSGPFVLTEEQVRLIVAWYQLDPLTGEFVHRRGASRRSKGTGKSPFAGALCVAELCLDVVPDGFDAAGRPVGRPWGTAGLPPAWIQIASLSEDQSGNTFEPLRAFLLANDGKAADQLGLDVGVDRVQRRGQPGKVETATSRAGSREGQPLTFAVLDETSLMVRENSGTRLAATIRRNLSKLNGRCWETTNGYRPGESSVAEQTEAAALAGRAGILLDVVEAPRAVDGVEVSEDAPDAVLRAALEVPYRGCWWTNLDRLVADIRDADQPWSDSERWFFNWCVASESKAVTPARWAELAQPERVVDPGRRIGLGFDGSFSEDSTALVACTDDGHSFPIRVWERPTDAEGHPVKDWRVPRGEVTATVRETFAMFDVGRVLADLPGWYSEIEAWAAEFDRDDEPVVIGFDTNRPRQFSQAVDRWRTAIREGSHTHDGSETLTRHVQAATLKPVRVKADTDDGRTLFVIVKGDDGRKIDAAVADCLAHEAAATMPARKRAELEPWFTFS